MPSEKSKSLLAKIEGRNMARFSRLPGRHTLGRLPGRHTLGQNAFDSFGATLWEYFNPEQVAAEYEMQEKIAPPPVTFDQVLMAAREDARDVASAAGAEFTEGLDALTSGAKKAALALAIGAGVYLAWKASGKRRRK
jgi:hypothetical protein